MDQFSTPNPPGNASQPAENYSGLKPPESMSMNPTPQARALVFPGAKNQPGAVPPPATPMEEKPPRSAGSMVGLISLLVFILIAAILVFLSWKGYISLGGIEKIWGGGKTTPTPAIVIDTATPTPESFDAQRKKDLATLVSILKNYYADNSSYPVADAEIKTSDSTSVLSQALAPAYIPVLPDDPLSPQYYYGYKSDGKTFTITAVLEDQSDTSGVIHGNLNIYTVTDTTGQ